MPTSENPIGEYLRARRELVRPEEVGLPDLGSGRRRVPGLRREEVAMLAGVSADYYVRLEQGRDQHPSEGVIEALGRALLLDDDAIAHLRGLATPTARRRRAPRRPERVPPGILELLDSLHETPAYVYGRYLDVLAANPLATALVPYYRVGVNLVRASFLDPAIEEFGPATATAPPKPRSPRSAPSPAPTSTTRGWRSWSANSRCAPSASANYGRATTSSRSAPGGARSSTREWGRSTSATRSCRSPTPTG